MKRYLIIGGNGLIGKYLRKLLAHEEVYFTSRQPSEDKYHIPCDLFEAESIQSAVDRVMPHVVINCANLSGGVDYCENHPDQARKFHVEGTRILAEASARHGALFVFISTDYVFDGMHPPYAENDKPNPLNVYGRCKLEAETWISDQLKAALIIRTTNVYGWDPLTKTPNFLMSLYFKLKSNQQVQVPSYLYGNPTYAENLAEAILEMAAKGEDGLYHVVGSGFINRFEWAHLFCKKFNLDVRNLIEVERPPIDMVPRPLSSHLSTKKFCTRFKTRLLSVEEGMELFLKESKMHKLIS